MAYRYQTPDELRYKLLDSSDIMQDLGISLTHDMAGLPMWFVHQVAIRNDNNGADGLEQIARDLGYKVNHGFNDGMQWWVYQRCYPVADIIAMAHVEALCSPKGVA